MIIREPRRAGDKRSFAKGLQSGDVHKLANRLRRYFAPNSVLPPPLSLPTRTGNRSTAITSANSANNRPDDSTIVQLKPGGTAASAVWTYSTKFNNPPIVTATAVSANPTAPAELTIRGIGSPSDSVTRAVTGVIVQSSDPNDTRFVHVHATGNPD
jgi:hypothetical protein